VLTDTAGNLTDGLDKQQAAMTDVTQELKVRSEHFQKVLDRLKSLEDKTAHLSTELQAQQEVNDQQSSHLKTQQDWIAEQTSLITNLSSQIRT
jgi:uncharacterized protein YdcH (DUF465 family)